MNLGRLSFARFHHKYPADDLLRHYFWQSKQDLTEVLRSLIAGVGQQLEQATVSGHYETTLHINQELPELANQVLNKTVYSLWGAYAVPQKSSLYLTTYRWDQDNPELSALGKTSLFTHLKATQEHIRLRTLPRESDGMLLAVAGAIPVIRAVAATRIPGFINNKCVEISGFPNKGPAADALSRYLHSDDYFLPIGLTKQEMDLLIQAAEKLKLPELRTMAWKQMTGTPGKITEIPLASRLYRLQQGRQLTDMVLSVRGGNEFVYHRDIMESLSLSSSDKFPEKVDVSPRAAAEFIKYCYGQLWRIPEDWSEELVNDVNKLADLFQLRFLSRITDDELRYRNLK